MIDTRLGSAKLLDFLPDHTLPAATLLELTGDKSKAKASRFPSGLEKRVAEAWVTPANDLNCGQCRMLIGQKLGLPWLARPVAAFVAKFPEAECDLYPGDLTVAALLAWRELILHAPDETTAMLALDFGWLKQEAECDKSKHSIVKEAVAALDKAHQN